MADVKVDTSQFNSKVKAALKGMDKRERDSNIEVAEEVLRLSQLEVPHDEGTLAGTGTVTDNYEGDVAVGYNTPYAARLHEHPEYNFQKGRKGKYLTDPINRNFKKLKAMFTQQFGKK